MANSVFYIFDNKYNIGKILGYCAAKNVEKVFLCPVTTCQDAVSSLVKAFFPIKKRKVEVLPFLEYFHKTAFSERDNFIRFISQLGQAARFDSKNLREYFGFPGSSFSAWWLSSIVEKNPLKSDSYHNLIKLLTVFRLREESKSGKIITDIDSPRLCRAIKNNAGNLEYKHVDLRGKERSPRIPSFYVNLLKGLKEYFHLAYRAIVLVVNARGLGFRKKILKDTRFAVVTYFPLMDMESFRQKRFVNKYYTSLQGALENKYKERHVWLAITPPNIGGLSFRKCAGLGRQINLWNYPLYFLEEWLSPKDLLFVLPVLYLYFLVKFIIKLPSLEKKMEYSKNKIKIWDIFEEDWFSSFAGKVLMYGIWYYRAFGNISKKLKEGSTVMYPAENQPWEKALNAAFHGEEKFKTIGILHTTLPLLLLKFFDSENDLKETQKAGFVMPMPDYLACNGKIPHELELASGWDKKRAFLWFAIRYQHLKKHLEKSVSWQARQNKILITLCVNPDELEEMLFYIQRAFKGDVGYRVIIKEHYSFPIHPFIKRLNINLDGNIFVVSDENLNAILPTVKAMILTSSSAALDAIAMGCPVIIPRLSSVVDMNPLSGISDLAIYTASPGQLRATVDEIMLKKETPLPRDKCREFIENYFRFFNSEKELLRDIEKL